MLQLLYIWMEIIPQPNRPHCHNAYPDIQFIFASPLIPPLL